MRLRNALPLAAIIAIAVSGCAPTSPNDRFRAAIVAESQGNFAQAIDTFTQLLATAAPTDVAKANLYNFRCVAYDHSGETEKAIADCNEALRLKPDLVFAYNNRAMAYLGAGQFDLAIADLDVDTRMKPDDAVAFENRGFASLRKGDYSHALADLNEAIKLKPNLSLRTPAGARSIWTKATHQRHSMMLRKPSSSTRRTRSPMSCAASSMSNEPISLLLRRMT